MIYFRLIISRFVWAGMSIVRHGGGIPKNYHPCFKKIDTPPCHGISKFQKYGIINPWQTTQYIKSMSSGWQCPQRPGNPRQYHSS